MADAHIDELEYSKKWEKDQFQWMKNGSEGATVDDDQQQQQPLLLLHPQLS